MRNFYVFAFIFSVTTTLCVAEPDAITNIPIWPDLAPGETSREVGKALPPRKPESKITRIAGIRRPTLDIYLADKPNGVGVLILPGGGFNYVVTDMEGSAAAKILNKLGISCFVLRYRTKLDENDSGWKGALQDAQRGIKLIRANAKEWKLDEAKIGLMGFSSGGQTAARLLTDNGERAYESLDATDKIPHQPDFSILIYPWRMYVEETDSLLPEMNFTAGLPPTFIVHTHDDKSSSIGAALFYIGLKKAGGDAEIHVYENGGHGYGTRGKKNSNIGTWPERMKDWLRVRKLTT